VTAVIGLLELKGVHYVNYDQYDIFTTLSISCNLVVIRVATWVVITNGWQHY
ncbi:14413_t:CDS:2, partial [Dentiscutata heterogama]